MKNSNDLKIAYHPIYNNANFFIRTPMVDNLLVNLTDLVVSGAPGGVVISKSREGKSFAAKHLSRELENIVGEPISANKITVAIRDQKTVLGMYRRLCISLRLPIKPRANSDELSNLVLNRLSDLSFNNATRQVVLMVDEFDRMRIDQFGVFSELYDELIESGVNLVTIFIGNKNASKSLRKKVGRKKYDSLHGRFFSRRYSFSGISSLTDLKNCLAQYDDPKITTHNLTHTQFFAGGIYGINWQLTSIAETIWEIYTSEFKNKHGMTSWPMQYFVSSIRTLLSFYLRTERYSDDQQLRGMIRNSIASSGMPYKMVKHGHV